MELCQICGVPLFRDTYVCCTCGAIQHKRIEAAKRSRENNRTVLKFGPAKEAAKTIALFGQTDEEQQLSKTAAPVQHRYDAFGRQNGAGNLRRQTGAAPQRRKRYCRFCGVRVNAEDRYCFTCGKQLWAGPEHEMPIPCRVS